MIFQRKYEKQMENLKQKNTGSPKALEDDELANKLEKGDVPAMIIAALIVIVPAALVFLLAVAAFGFFFIAR